MNSTHYRALAAATMACGGVAITPAQVFDDFHCVSTTPYSDDYGTLFASTALFGAGIGVRGKANWVPGCRNGLPVPGRIGFNIGPLGSIQDNLNPDLYGGRRDEGLRLTEYFGTDTGVIYAPTSTGDTVNVNRIVTAFGHLSPSGGGGSYARIYVTDSAGATTNYLYGAGGLSSGYYPISGRYMVTSDAITTGITADCIIEILGDAARVNWTLRNSLTGAAGAGVALGLYFAQNVAIADDSQNATYLGSALGNRQLLYITAPGQLPLTAQRRYQGTDIPSFVNFSPNQNAGFGLQVVNNPSALQAFDASASADQTPVDEFAIGLGGLLISENPSLEDPPIPDGLQGGDLAASLDNIPAYLQKWIPTTVAGSGGTRSIISYYRSTSGASSYAPLLTGYTVTADAPQAISTTTTTSVDGSVTYAPNPFRIRAYVDNTGGFSVQERQVRMSNVTVRLDLPAGMHEEGQPNNRTIVRNISTIAPINLGYVDFPVEVEPTVFGAQTYTITVSPNPGGFIPKTVTGTINVSAVPRLLIRTGPNLVAPPWEFDDRTWSTVLGQVLNGGIQTYTWDAQTQRYITQVSAERKVGTWVVSLNDQGNIPLGGNPQTPGDQLPDADNFTSGGAGFVRLYPGWNLVGNPYAYAFPLGGLLGVPRNATNAAPLKYSELVALNYTDGSFTAYDQDLRSYARPIQGATSRLQPNLGYWFFSNVAMDLQFPPVYDLFIRSAAPKAQPQRFDNWSLQLSAANSASADSQNFVGTVRNPVDAKLLSSRKAPIQPNSAATQRAIRAYVTGTSNAQMAQSLRYATGQQKFTYTVESRSAGPVTVSWPNIKALPSNLAVQVKDSRTGKTVNARSAAGYSYNEQANSSRSFLVTVTPQSTVAQRVNSVTTTAVTAGPTKQMKINYFVTGRGGATITVLKGSQVVSTIADDVDIVAGQNSILWAMVGSNGQALPTGKYTLQVAATGEAGKTAYRQISITVNR